MTKRIAIYALTRRGASLGATLAAQLNADLHVPVSIDLPKINSFNSLPQCVAELFACYDAHIFIAATGIAVRIVAPLLTGKDTDPAVLVLDQEGKHVISLLSGHIGGANELASQVAALTGGTAVITTATDTAGLPSLDMLALKQGLAIGNLTAVKHVNAALLDGIVPQVYDPENRLGISRDKRFESVTDMQSWDRCRPGVWVDWQTTAPGPNELRLYPPVLFAGLGCRKGVKKQHIEAHLRQVFKNNGLAIESLARLGTIEEKRYEAGLAQTALSLGVPIDYYTKDQLNGVENTAPSEIVQKHMGVDSVCEAAAILASSNGKLIVTKAKTDRVTAAVALSLL